MMSHRTPAPLRLGVLGMEERTINLFRMFLRGPCQNAAEIVAGNEVEAYLVDLDSPQGKSLFAKQRETNPDLPCILLSLKPQTVDENTLFVQKPAQTHGMLAAIKQTRARVSARQTYRASDQPTSSPVSMKVVATAKKTDASTHKVAMLLDEKGFKTYLGHRDDIDPGDPAQLVTVFYDPREFFLGFVQSAYKLALSTEHALRIETPWKAITILPQQQKIWIDADEAQLRAACAIPFRKIANPDIGAGKSTATVKELDEDQVERISNHENTISLEAFLWKVALWSSKGRVPRGVDLNHQALLKRWPNFTRLLVMPHAMRIAALLHRQPCNLFEAARILGIRQQYVFAFFSAAYAQGLIEMMPPVFNPPSTVDAPPSSPEKAERTSLLKKILHRLKAI